jgi:UDP-N-acetylglucosamine:LPS N-acetylglucosamine transferase
MSSEAGESRREPGSQVHPGLRLALAGGGTGGHIVPGLHLLGHVAERGATLETPLADLVWLTSGRPVEQRVLASLPAGIACDRVALPLEPEGGGAPSRSALVLRTPLAVARARRALVRHRSEVLLGLGGFTALPAVIAARSLGVPVALIEINAITGSATRWLGRFAARVFHAWRSTLREGEGSVDRWIGPPLAPEFALAACGGIDPAAARAALGFDAARPLLVVLGGSQGAGALNRFVREHAPALVASGIQILHQTGPDKLGEACEPFSGYRSAGYLSDVARALAAATVVLCRGGASTLAEVAATRRPALVVPYPHHADRHQERNAAELGQGAIVILESQLGLATRETLIELCGTAGSGRRERMSAALAEVVPSDSAARLWAELVLLARSRRGRSTNSPRFVEEDAALLEA